MVQFKIVGVEMEKHGRYLRNRKHRTLFTQLEFESHTEISGWVNEWMSTPGTRREKMSEKRLGSLRSLRCLGDTRHFDMKL